MSQNIKIRKGVDIRLVGTPGDTVSAAKRSKTYAIQPPNFEGLTPKLIVKEGATVKLSWKSADTRALDFKA